MRDGAFHLPALTVLPLGEALLHLAVVLGLRPLAALVAAVDRDDGGANLEGLSAVAMVVLAVKGGVTQDAVPGDHHRGLAQRRAELGGIVTRTQADGGGGEELTAGVAADRELDPRLGAALLAGPLEEVARGVPALQAGGVEGGLGPRADQAALLGADGGLEEEQQERPFFSSP